MQGGTRRSVKLGDLPRLALWRAKRGVASRADRSLCIRACVHLGRNHVRQYVPAADRASVLILRVSFNHPRIVPEPLASSGDIPAHWPRQPAFPPISTSKQVSALTNEEE